MQLRLTSATRRPSMSMTPQPLVLQTDSLRQQLDQVIAFVQTALQHGEALHTIEGGIWDRFLQLGHQLLEQIFPSAATATWAKLLSCLTAKRCIAFPNCTAAAMSPSSATSNCGAPSTAAAKDRKSSSCLWTTACSCRAVPSPSCCKTGTRPCVSKRRSAKSKPPWRGCCT